ncbi:hypothetical protein WN944_026971 [Citrus x changshan-huyou]|uniref:Ribosome biogenesis NEP1-like protein n=3 Tax=Citrus TaxID=2706 RepID=A0ACB8INC8_CITSI|nr:Ribosome biogenesis NEP1-like protein [Citrus sinensis]KDO40106.1 hypothetical protein CISIN_1g044853mg [Citrus sinensis]GAY40598.1 hypothetical protein CUMW_053210 [Citrus unshiu]
MACRATVYWRSMLIGLGGNRSFATSTTPKMKHFAQTAEAANGNHSYSKFSATGEFAPIYMVLGLVAVAVTIGTHTIKQQLAHSPSVSLSKKKRSSLSEVEDPESAVNSSDKFVNKSFLRKVAHIQDDNRVLPDIPHPDPFTRARKADTP